MLRIKGDQDIDSLVVQECGDIAGDYGLIPFSDGKLMPERHGLTVDGKPGIVLRSKKISVVVEVKDRIQAEVNIPVSVVIEQIILQAFHQIPLFFGQCDALLSGGIGVPDQPGRVKAVGRNILCSFFVVQRTSREEAGVAGGIAGNGGISAAQEGIEQFRDHFHIAGGGATVAPCQDRWHAVPVDAGSRLAADLKAGKGADGLGIALVHADRVISVARRINLAGLAVREIDGQAVGIRHVAGGLVVLNRLLQGFDKALPLCGAEIVCKVDQVDLVNDGAAGELTGVVACIRDLSVFVLLDQFGQRLGEVLQRLGDGIGKLRKVHNGERGALAARLRRTGRDKVINDVLADFDRGHAGIGAQSVQPVGVVPADARLGFLRGNHVVGVIVQHESGFQGRHQACVKADEIEGDAAFL